MTDMTMVGVRFPVARRRHLALAGRCPPSLWDCLCYIRPVCTVPCSAVSAVSAAKGGQGSVQWRITSVGKVRLGFCCSASSEAIEREAIGWAKDLLAARGRHGFKARFQGCPSPAKEKACLFIWQEPQRQTREGGLELTCLSLCKCVTFWDWVRRLLLHLRSRNPLPSGKGDEKDGENKEQ